LFFSDNAHGDKHRCDPQSFAFGQLAQLGHGQAQGARIGWVDTDGIYLDPKAWYRVAQGMAGPTGDTSKQFEECKWNDAAN
jgi:hypothetical protein